MTVSRIEMLNAPCDRCGRESERLAPFKLRNPITYRNRDIADPWLCRGCMRIEKNKCWKGAYGQLVAINAATGEGRYE